MATVSAEIYHESIFLREVPARTAKNMVSLQSVLRAILAAKETILIVHRFHLPSHADIKRSSSSGGIVSIPASLHSCTTISISLDICAVSYVEEP